MADRRRRRGLFLAAVVALAAAGLLTWLWGTGSQAPAGEEAGPPDPTVTMAPLRPHGLTAMPPAEGESLEAPQGELGPGRTVPAPLPPPPELPPDTQALTAEFRPGTSDWDEVPVSEGGHRLRILPRRYNVIVPEPIVLLVELRGPDGARGRLDGARVVLRSLDRDGRPLESAAVDDGTRGDEAAGDLLYTATFAPAPADRASLVGRVLAEADVTVPGVGERTVHTTLIYTVGPRARLTGAWRDWKEGGHLYVEAQVEVAEPGTFALMAQVLGPQLEPIAWVRAMDALDAGRHPLVLRVWGPLLRERGVDGPYRIREVMLTREMNERGDYDPGPTIEEAWRTAAYRASEFFGDRYDGPEVAPPAPGVFGARPGEPPALRAQSERASAPGRTGPASVPAPGAGPGAAPAPEPPAGPAATPPGMR